MPRPRKLRRIYDLPKADYFKPGGIPLRDLKSVEISPEEIMMMKLVDFDGYEQEKAADIMKISRKTLWRDLTNTRKKIIDAIFNGKAIEIKGGKFELKFRLFRCRKCGYEWKEPFGTEKPKECPKCGSTAIYRIDNKRDAGRGGCFGRKMGRGRGLGRGFGRKNL